MYRETVKLRLSKLDQTNLAMKIEEWKQQYPQNEFYFRGYGKIVDQTKDTENIDEEDINNEEIKVSSSFILINPIRLKELALFDINSS